MAKVTGYTKVSSGQEDSVIDELDLSEKSLEKLREVIDSIALKAYERGHEDGYEEGLAETGED